MTMTRQLSHFVVLGLALSVLALIFTRQSSELSVLASVLRLHMGTDSSRFMDQAWQTFHAGQPLYRTLFFARHIKFIYPPSSLLLYWLPGLVHLSGKSLLDAVVLLSIPGTLYVAGKIFVQQAAESLPLPSTESRDLRILVAILGLLFYPFLYGAHLGQIQTFLTFLWTLTIWSWMTRRKPLAGVTLALICVFKPTLAVFLVWALLRREWRFFLWLAGSLIAIQSVSIALFGWRNELDYLAVLSFISHHGEAFVPNQTINGMLERFTRNGNMVVWGDTTYPPYNRLVYLGTTLSSAMLLFFSLAGPVVLRWRNRLLDLLLCGMLATLASPIAWEHHYGYFFAPCIVLLASMLSQARPIPGLFTASFLVMTTSWSFLYPLAGTLGTPLLNPYLFAGLGIIAVTVWELELGRRTASLVTDHESTWSLKPAAKPAALAGPR